MKYSLSTFHILWTGFRTPQARTYVFEQFTIFQFKIYNLIFSYTLSDVINYIHVCLFVHCKQEKWRTAIVQCCGQCFTHPFGFYDLKKNILLVCFGTCTLCLKAILFSDFYNSLPFQRKIEFPINAFTENNEEETCIHWNSSWPGHIVS